LETTSATADRGCKLAADSPDGSYTCFGGPKFPPSGLLGGWAPGATPPSDSPALSQLLRKGTDVVLKVYNKVSAKEKAQRQPAAKATASVKAHKEDRATVNAVADVPAAGLDVDSASHLFSQCVQPAALYAAHQMRDSDQVAPAPT